MTWDHNLFLALNHDGGAFWDAFWWTVTEKITWAPLYLLIIFMLWRQLGWRKMVLAVAAIALAVGAADQVAGFFKAHVPRLRPSHTPQLEGLVHLVRNWSGEVYRGWLYGTVSAHAATTAAIAVISCSLLHRRWLAVAMPVWVAMVCYSRIYVAAHYPQDILFGLTLGVLLGLGMVWVFGKVAGRWKWLMVNG